MNSNVPVRAQQQMMCHVCPGRKRATIAANDAERIVCGLEEVIRKYSVTERRLDTQVPTLHTPVRCQYAIRNCSRFEQEKSRLERAERVMNSRFRQINAMIAQLQSEDRIEEAELVLEESRRLLAGHYTNGAYHLSRAYRWR